MAMNFKIFETPAIAAAFVSDVVRKQMNANPTSNIVFALGDESEDFHHAFSQELNAQPVDTSQINIFDYDLSPRSFLSHGFVQQKVYEVKHTTDVVDEVNDKDKENKKGKITMLVATLSPDGSIGYRDVTGDADKGLLAAREIVLLVTGSEKLDVVNKLYNTDEVNTTFSAGNLKLHRMVTVVLDEAAAQGLPADVRDYYFEYFA